jgi:hypothetical protein
VGSSPTAPTDKELAAKQRLFSQRLGRGEQVSQKDTEQDPADDEHQERQRCDGGRPLVGCRVDLLETERAKLQSVQADQLPAAFPQGFL